MRRTLITIFGNRNIYPILLNTKNYLLLTILFFLEITAVRAQSIKGTVVDKETNTPLIGAIVQLKDTAIGGVADTNGKFEINNVPLGKHTLIVSYFGYLTIPVPDIVVTSAKEVILTIALEESAQELKTVSVVQSKSHINEMAVVSAKTFNVDEVQRYAGSRSDIPRMASNFAGVQGNDDSRNDIVIRGNSPQGVLWRLEDIDIPNPNHFNIPGTTGGPVTVLNENTLSNCDFFTGAFPAEYGNGVAGVFDVKLREGNPDRNEFTAQLGFLGTELCGEGPISKSDGSSYLFTYRYSTLQLFTGLHINVGTTAIPNYQDATFKLNFPLSKKTTLSLFGIGGLSTINQVFSNLTSFQPDLYGPSDRDQYFSSNMGVLGLSLNHTFNNTTFTRLVIAETGSDVFEHNNYIFRNNSFQVDSLKSILGYNDVITATVMHWYVNKKLSARHTLRFGILNSLYRLNMQDSNRENPVTRQNWQYASTYKGTTDLAQAYIQYKYRPSDNLTLTAGLHAQYLTHNHSEALEPRAGAKWIMDEQNSFSLGYGLHSEMLPLYQYYSYVPGTDGTGPLPNYNVGFIRSEHFVAGYYHNFSSSLRLETEVYYQYLYDVPIETRIGSSFSALNEGTTYDRAFPDTLVNKGTGYNYGLELTLEKSFGHGYYFLFTSTLFNSEAKGEDGVYRPTNFDNRYIFNLLGGYEHKLGNKTTFISGIKITYTGGLRYSPPDIAATNATGYFTVVDSLRNTLQFRPYFRIDLKIGVRINGKHLTHELALDLVNLLNTSNVLAIDYSSTLAQEGSSYPFYTIYELGFLPLFYYKVDFGINNKKAVN
jgi:hypothetical protein